MAHNKPKIAILATGGTIAGKLDNKFCTTNYKAGIFGVKELIKAVPELQNLAQIKSKQIANIDSSNMNDALWLKLAKEINKLLEQDTDAIIITHGTDTMEETAYFLNLTLKSDKAVVLVGAMRPFEALSSDGSKNLYNALVLATNENSKNKGVMITMNDRIFSARELVKTHTLNVDAFSSPNFGDLGYIIDEKCFFYNQNLKSHTKKSPFDVSKLRSLPKVDILYTYSNDGSGVAAKALFENGTRALVIAGSGAGNIHENQKKVLKELMKQGLIVVVSSRVGAGQVVLNKEDIKLGFISSLDLNPQKARVLLSLALTRTKDIKKIREYFEKY
ncbi:MAG: type II asparaginase [Campylobacter sp.]|nr:type II asparaginase [Campylobacter sp.]